MPVSDFNSTHTYLLYGHAIRSDQSLPYLSVVETDSVDFEFFSDPVAFASEEIKQVVNGLDVTNRFHYAHLSDGSDFIRWTGLFDFIVSADGQIIVWRSLGGHSPEVYQTYLLGQVLSFGMVRRGIEPLHATVIVKDGQAAAFLGDCGYGKSTLAGAFLRAGLQILTDDMLIIKKKSGEYLAYPGPPRIKLYPEMAKALIAEEIAGIPMNQRTTKLIFPLPGKDVAPIPFPLKIFYALQSPEIQSGGVAIDQLSQSQALLAIVRNTYNTVLKSPERLAQQFRWAVALSANLPVKSLSYPRELSFLPRVLDAVLKDMS